MIPRNPAVTAPIVLTLLLTLTGCYTQLRETTTGQTRPVQRIERIMKGDSAVADTFFFVVDTVTGKGGTTYDTTWYAAREDLPGGAVSRKELHHRIDNYASPPYCLWTRDFLGNLSLQCFDSWADYRFYIDTYSPWWIRDRLYTDGWGGCPPGYYFDPYDGSCRHRGDLRIWLDRSRYGDGYYSRENRGDRSTRSYRRPDSDEQGYGNSGTPREAPERRPEPRQNPRTYGNYDESLKGQSNPPEETTTVKKKKQSDDQDNGNSQKPTPEKSDRRKNRGRKNPRSY
jgi:hypothetical protein